MSCWSKHHTSEGQAYYYNAADDTTQWAKPADYIEELTEEGGGGEGVVGADGEEGGQRGEEIGGEAREGSFAVYTIEDGFLYELQSMGLFEKKTTSSFEESHFSGRESEECLTMLSFLQSALQEGKGTDSEWISALQANDFALTEYLLSFLDNRTHPEHCDTASRCLAFAGNIYGNLWADYVVEESQLRLLLTASEVSVSKAARLSSVKASGASVADSSPYLGFDERDIKEFNLVGYEGETQQSRNRRSSTHGLVGLEDVDDSHAAILVWLLLITQFFSNEIPLLPSLVRAQRALAAEQQEPSVEEISVFQFDTSLSPQDHVPLALQGITRLLVGLSDCVLRFSKNFSEDAYLQCIKAVAAINRQMPYDEVGTTENAKVCAALHFNPDFGVNLSEGLLHILNEIGYPSHTAPETAPILRLCINLVNDPSNDGFFYTNDVKIIVDVILRELGNIPHAHAAESEQQSRLDEEIRVLYLRFAGALISKSAWRNAGESYHKEELREAFSLLMLEDGTCGEWSKDVASEVFADVEALLV